MAQAFSSLARIAKNGPSIFNFGPSVFNFGPKLWASFDMSGTVDFGPNPTNLVMNTSALFAPNRQKSTVLDMSSGPLLGDQTAAIKGDPTNSLSF